VIGIAWSGGIPKTGSKFRRAALDDWMPVFAAIDAHWVCLQYRDASDEIAEFTKAHPHVDLVQYPWATLTKDYDDTAALVASCDLVIAMQTSVNHLSGALGVPTWTLIPTTSQWRYGETYTDLPWYSSVKLYRQQGENWPVAQIVNDLKARFA
jgi:ADP-heptose:LPS heptosyltransferase